MVCVDDSALSCRRIGEISRTKIISPTYSCLFVNSFPPLTLMHARRMRLVGHLALDRVATHRTGWLPV